MDIDMKTRLAQKKTQLKMRQEQAAIQQYKNIL